MSAQVATGKVSGKITDAMTRQPIARAHVGCVVGSQFVGVLSGVDGAYILENVPPGDARMTINLEGYKLISDNEEPSAEFDLAGGQEVRRDFAMHPLGRIYGRLTDRDSGKLLALHVVSAERRMYAPGRVFYFGSGPLPPGNGEFNIEGLEAGDYRISIDSPAEAVVIFPPESPNAKPAAAAAEAVYGRRWYPDVRHEDMASLVPLGEGEALRLDIALQAAAPHTLSGAVVAPRGMEQEPVNFTLFRGEAWQSAPQRMAAPGPFRIEDLAPGSYRLRLTARKPPRELAGDYEFEIGDRNIENFKAALLPEAGVAGEVRMLEQDAKLPATMFLEFVPTSGWTMRFGKRGGLVSGPLPIFGVHVEAGHFQQDSIRPGEYWPLATAPEGYAVAQLKFEGASPLNNAMQLSAPATPLTIMLTARPGAVTGMVRDSSEAPVRGATVALLPDPLPEKIGPNTIRFTQSAGGGGFAFKDVAPGNYRAFVVKGELDTGGSHSSLDAFAARGEAVEVKPGEAAVVELKR